MIGCPTARSICFGLPVALHACGWFPMFWVSANNRSERRVLKAEEEKKFHGLCACIAISVGSDCLQCFNQLKKSLVSPTRISIALCSHNNAKSLAQGWALQVTVKYENTCKNTQAWNCSTKYNTEAWQTLCIGMLWKFHHCFYSGFCCITKLYSGTRHHFLLV